MIKLELTGPGYTLLVMSDPHDGELMLSIEGTRRSAVCELSHNQIIQLHAHLSYYMRRRKEQGKE